MGSQGISPAAFGTGPVQADLHVHSAYSDGRCGPGQLWDLAALAGITHLALCDHDTLSGLGPMAAALEERAQRGNAPRPLPVLIPGVELSTGDTGQTHVLGYGVQAGHPELEKALEESKARRQERYHRMLERLGELGIQVPPALLPQEGQGPLGRAHVARALVAMGAVGTLNEAFDRYLGSGKPAYIPYPRMGTREAVALLRRAGAVPVLAHPCRMELSQPALFAFIQSLQEAGLQGVEVYHPSAGLEQAKLLEAYARRQNLLVTGGSDFHGDPGHGGLGRLGWQTQREDVEALLVRITQAPYSRRA